MRGRGVGAGLRRDGEGGVGNDQEVMSSAGLDATWVQEGAGREEGDPGHLGSLCRVTGHSAGPPRGEPSSGARSGQDLPMSMVWIPEPAQRSPWVGACI